ncbi:MAG: AAA family ATPase [Thermodesulfobacteriota bacterium]|nr:AAA family ATPase [Thermodesulfobacteriota bacterium]
MPKKHRRKKQILTDVKINLDKNECFALKKCTLYLRRHLDRYFTLDKETMNILCYTLRDEMARVSEYILDLLDDSLQMRFKEELSECGLDTEEYSDLAARMLAKVKTGRLYKFKQFIFHLLEQNLKKFRYNGKSDIEKTITAIKKMFDLTEQEVEFSLFLFITAGYEIPRDFFTYHLKCDEFAGRKNLVNILNLTQREFNKILEGTLARTGLLETSGFDLSITDDFISLIQNSSTRSFTKSFFSKIPPNTVPLEYHFVEQEQTEHILELLKHKPETATHILLYGSPGTGKTSYAYGLAEKLRIPAYEIVRGDDNKTSQRRAAIIASLNMTNSDKGSLILIDEADNILNTYFSWFMRGETQDKGWLNQILEEPGTRMIWITNSIDGIEKSVLRRFAYSLCFKPFNRKQRIRLWDSVLKNNSAEHLMSDTDIANLSGRYKVSAGAMDIAVKKAVEKRAKSKKKFHKAVTLTLDSHESLFNYGKKHKNKDSVEKNYSLKGLNLQGNIQLLMQQLEKFDNYLQQSDGNTRINMNLLFYGPPGSGKSELARYIACHLDKELICKRLSDILDCFVGGTEQNIKEAFEEAESEEAVLIIDEVDSLLFSRDQAQRSWEISFTNEFLTQMERYRGILICTTNRLKGIDKASIRRFNYKIGFNYLKPDGNVIFYQKLLEPLTSSSLNKATREALKKIIDLAPGDFKVVRDKNFFHRSEELSPQSLVQALREEAEVKKFHSGRKHIGF